MSRPLGEKSQAILDVLTDHPGNGLVGLGSIALCIGDHEPNAEVRVKALLQNLKGKGLVHQPAPGRWAAGPAPDGAEPLPEPALAQTGDARRRNSGPRGPRKAAARIKVATPKAAPPPPIDAHEVCVSSAGEVLVLSAGAVITRLSPTVARQVAEVVTRLGARA